MFTGIVAAVGRVAEIERTPGGARFVLNTGKLDLQGVRVGDSIAVNGACLTVTVLNGTGFSADLSQETLACTTLGSLQPDHPVNFERALALGEALGGHLVTGHVDGVGHVLAVVPAGDSLELAVRVPPGLAGYVARKGSVCVDGTSLTVNHVDGEVFRVMLVPHTQQSTIVRHYRPGTHVNIEVDIIARYLERLVQYTGAGTTPGHD